MRGATLGLVALLSLQHAAGFRVYPQDDSSVLEVANDAVSELAGDWAVDSRASRRRTAIASDGSKAEDDLVTGLPGLTEAINVTHHAGLIPLDEKKQNQLFYWHFEAARDAKNAPLVVWLNGGPGCSSMQGLFLGISPFSLINGTHIKHNKHSWHEAANVLFVDQPVGTGMSSKRGNEIRTSESAIAVDFHSFLIKFLQRHSTYLTTDKQPKVQISRPLFIFGESHAGRYIPQFSDYILHQNDKARDSGEGVVIQLNGVGIGNGWVHPFVQYDYSDYAHGIGLITRGQVRALKEQYATCKEALEAGTYFSSSCFDNMNTILDSVKNADDIGMGRKINVYDVREYVRSTNDYPPGREYINEYLNQLEARKALHANMDATFVYADCSDEVYEGLREFDGVSSLENVQYLLKRGLRVLFYNGQWDMMCNHYTTEELLLNLDWSGASLYQSAKKYTWAVDNRAEPAGFVQNGGNLTYLVIAGAGHMVPLDVPDVALDMLTRFVQDKSYEDTAQAVPSVPTNMTDLASIQCSIPSATLTTQGPSGKWAWIVLVVAAVSSALSVSVTMMCMRPKSRQSSHQLVLQENDDDDDDDDDIGSDEDEDEEVVTRLHQRV